MTGESIQEMLKRDNPNYSDKIDEMILIAQRVADSDDPVKSMDAVLHMLNAMDAYIFGMIVGEFIKNGILHIEGLHIDTCKEEKMEENKTSAEKMMKNIGDIVQIYIESMKENNQELTRSNVLEVVADKLEKIIKLSSEKGEIMLITSGITVGIAIVLEIENRLAMEK